MEYPTGQLQCIDAGQRSILLQKGAFGNCAPSVIEGMQQASAICRAPSFIRSSSSSNRSSSRRMPPADVQRIKPTSMATACNQGTLAGSPSPFRLARGRSPPCWHSHHDRHGLWQQHDVAGRQQQGQLLQRSAGRAAAAGNGRRRSGRSSSGGGGGVGGGNGAFMMAASWRGSKVGLEHNDAGDDGDNGRHHQWLHGDACLTSVDELPDGSVVLHYEYAQKEAARKELEPGLLEFLTRRTTAHCRVVPQDTLEEIVGQKIGGIMSRSFFGTNLLPIFAESTTKAEEVPRQSESTASEALLPLPLKEAPSTPAKSQLSVHDQPLQPDAIQEKEEMPVIAVSLTKTPHATPLEPNLPLIQLSTPNASFTLPPILVSTLLAAALQASLVYLKILSLRLGSSLTSRIMWISPALALFFVSWGVMSWPKASIGSS